MKKLRYISLGTILLAGIIWSATELQYFTAKNENESILLEWKTGVEDNLNRFEIERSMTNQNNFITIGTLNAIGNNSYYYFRDNLSSNPTSSTIYHYRLKMVDNNNNYVYSQTITVAHIISSVRDTWGSIKAIFR